MHFEFLVEGKADDEAFRHLVPTIIGPYGEPHTWRLLPCQGKGRLPENPEARPEAGNRTLLHSLPARLRAYAKMGNPDCCVVVVVDADDDDCRCLKKSLSALRDHCAPGLKVLIRIAVEETEAWYLGDAAAIRRAYPRARLSLLSAYIQDGIGRTWELAAAVTGGSKLDMASRIPPHMDVAVNLSPSFQALRDGLRAVAAMP